MKTYNQVIEVLRDIAGAHQQIETFGEGDVWDIAENTAYPLMYVTPQPGSLNIERSETSLSLSIIFADLAKEDKSNEAEVRSDMQQVAFDVLAQLQLPDYVDLFTVNPSARLTPFSDAHPDRVTGWVLELTLRMDYLSDWCIVPSTLQPGSEAGCPPVKVYDGNDVQIATVAAGATYTLADISVTDVLGAVSTHPGGVNITMTTPARAYASTQPTGRGTVFRTGDDADIQQTIFNALPTGYVVPLASFLVLRANNVFGNTNRFTDSLGTQVYANSYAIDHYTGLGWYLVEQAAVTWNNAIDGALAFTTLFTDWFLPNHIQILSVCQYNSSAGNGAFNFTPFNLITLSSTVINSSTTSPSGTTLCLLVFLKVQYGVASTNNKSSVDPYILCRKHF